MNKMALVKEHRQFYFLEILRGFAALLVVYDHLFSRWPERNHISVPLVIFIQTYVNKPLGIIQDFGWLGVSIFFLVSGFIITHVSLREAPMEFAVKRIFRIFPLLVIASILAIFLIPNPNDSVSLRSVLTNITLVNYWIHPQVKLVEAAWTLAIEAIFYTFTFLTMLTRIDPITRIVTNLLAVGIILLYSRSMGDNFFLFSASVAYLPYLISGQILYFSFYRQCITPIATAMLLIATYIVMLYGISTIHTQFLPIQNSYLLNFSYAMFIFVFGYFVNDNLIPSKIISGLADVSYPLYLFHIIIGYFVLNTYTPKVGFGAALLLALVAVGAFVVIIHKVIEKPTLRLGKNLAEKYVSTSR